MFFLIATHDSFILLFSSAHLSELVLDSSSSQSDASMLRITSPMLTKGLVRTIPLALKFALRSLSRISLFVNAFLELSVSDELVNELISSYVSDELVNELISLYSSSSFTGVSLSFLSLSTELMSFFLDDSCSKSLFLKLS